MIYPDIQPLLGSLFNYLQQSGFDVGASHPDRSEDLSDDKGRVILLHLSNDGEGDQLSRLSIEPIIQFTCWDKSHYHTNSLVQSVVDAIESMSTETVSTPDQKVNFFYRRSFIGSTYEKTSDLFVAETTYAFHLSKK